MLKFAHDIAGGQGNLIAVSVQSPNFVHDVSGWQIARDGSAEFNDLVIRGTFMGLNFEINSLGAFFYSGTPATGNLAVSITPAAGSDDGHGNAFQEDVTVYKAGAYAQLHVNSSLGVPALEQITGAATEAKHAAYYTDIGNKGGVAEAMASWLISPASSYDNVQAAIALASAAADGSSEAGGELVMLTGSTELIAYWDTTGVHVYDGKALTVADGGGTPWNVVRALTDVPATPVKVTAATWTDLSRQWPIPANDASSTTIYRVTAWGDLTTPGSSLQACRWQLAAYGLTGSTGLAEASIAAGALAASTTYEWRITADLIVKTAGSSGTVEAWLSGTLSVFGTNLTGSNSYALTGATGATSANTTGATTAGIRAEWATAETSQQVQCYGSTIERIGP